MTGAWPPGLRSERLRALATQFHDHWDLLAQVELPGATVSAPDLAPLAALLDRILDARHGCIVGGDLLRIHLETEVAAARQALDYATGVVGAARYLGGLRRLAIRNRGTKATWRRPSQDARPGLLQGA